MRVWFPYALTKREAITEMEAFFSLPIPREHTKIIMEAGAFYDPREAYEFHSDLIGGHFVH